MPVTHRCSAELGSVFYSVREKNFDDGSSRRRADREFSKKAELENQMKKQREEWVPSRRQWGVANNYWKCQGCQERDGTNFGSQDYN